MSEREFHEAAVQLVRDIVDVLPSFSMPGSILVRINALLTAPVPAAARPVDGPAWIKLTDDDRREAFESLPDMLEGFLKKWGWLHFAKEIERRCMEKNARAGAPHAGSRPVSTAHVPAEVLAALKRMSTPLDESILKGATAEADAHSMKLIRDYVLGAEPAQSSADAEDAALYRWLRAQNWNESTLFVVAGGRSAVRLGTDCPSGERLDEAIRAARSGGA